MRIPVWPPLWLALISPAVSAAEAPAPAASAAQPAASAPRVLTLAEATARALAQHPELAAARLAVEAEDAAVSQAGVLPNPTLDAEQVDHRRDSRETTLRLSQRFELGGQRAARVQAARLGRDAAAAALSASRAEVRAAVATAFYEAAIAQERVRLAEASLSLAEAGSSAAGQRVAAGRLSPVEGTRARVAESGVRLELLQARSELRIARSALAAAVGTPLDFDQVDEAADAPVPPAAAAAAADGARLADAPALVQGRLEAQRLGALAALERTRRVPDLTLSIGAKRSEELGRTQAVVALSIPLPLFDRNHGAEQEAARRRDRALAQLQATELRLQADVARAQEQAAAADAEVAALQQQVLPGAQGAWQAARRGFELGKFGFLDVLDAQRTLLQARTQYLRALAQRQRATTELHRLLGDEPAL